MLERSLRGARARFLDGEAVTRDLAERARALRAADRNVAAVYLFGSLARGNYTPRSDADVLVVERTPSAPRQMDRPPRYVDWFLGLAVPADVVVLTLDELAQLRAEGRLFAREAVDEGVLLAGSLDA